jgi:asparagine synthase (glutamine-hydrolysing)
MIRTLPKPMRQAIAGAITAVPPGAWDSLSRAVPRQMRPRLVGDKIHKLAGVLPEDSVGFYRRLITQWSEASSLVEGADAPDDSLYDGALRERFSDDVSWMQYLDTLTYLPDDILAKVDRASMAVALEVRVPLLDHRLVELSWRLPLRFKLRGGTGKWLLRQIAYKYVPKALLERPKMGFGVPIDQWLRGPLKEWAGDLLSPAALGEAGLLKPAPIAEKWAEHQAGTRNWQHFLWNVLMFEAWRASPPEPVLVTSADGLQI